LKSILKYGNSIFNLKKEIYNKPIAGASPENGNPDGGDAAGEGEE